MKKNILFLGVGGIGVSALALAAKKLGASVTGYDLKSSKLTQKLESHQIDIVSDIDNIDATDFDMVVYSSAIPLHNSVLAQARHDGIPILQRAMFLAELMKDFSQNIAITGTHGKTTTSSILASLLYKLDSSSSFVIGGMVKATNTNIETRGTGTLVLEADESDASFLYLEPEVAIVTNIDLDHMSTYKNSYNVLLENFYAFLSKECVETIIICIDDKGCRDLLSKYDLSNKNVISYGFSIEADVQVSNYEVRDSQSTFDINSKSFSTKLPGKYNVLNAVASIISCKELGFDAMSIANELTNVAGVSRRFDIHNITINNVNVDVVDDYGHHPVEVSSCLQAVRDRYPGKEIIHVFQPHRYSRNRDLFADWKKALQNSDKLLLLPTYSAGEDEIVGFTSEDMAKGLTNCELIANLESAKQKLKNIINQKSVVLVQGAGDVTNLIELLQNDK